MMREFWGSAQAPEFFALVQGWLGHAGGGERFRSPAIPASGSALGSLSSVALSSVRLLVAPAHFMGANFLNATPADGSGRCRERSHLAGKPR